MTSSDPLPDRLFARIAPPGMLEDDEREFFRNSLPVIGVMGPSVLYAAVLQVRQIVATVRTDSKLVRLTLLADLIADAAIIGYAQGESRQLRKTSTPGESMARLAEVKPWTASNWLRPVRGAAATALATSVTRSVPASIRSGLLTYALAIGIQVAGRALKPRMVAASALSAKFRREREEREKEALAGEATVVSPEDRVRQITEQLERLGAEQVVVVEDEAPRAYATPGERINVLGADVPRDKFVAALQRKLDEQEAARRAARGDLDDIVD